MSIEFSWDPAKAAANHRKHGVSFDEAATVFDDPHALIAPDARHSAGEERWAILGLSAVFERPLVVMFTERGEDCIRLISARHATARERTSYEEESR